MNNNYFLTTTIVGGAILGLAWDLSGKKCLKNKKAFGQEIPFTLVGALLGLASGIVGDSRIIEGMGIVLQSHPRLASCVIIPEAAYFGWYKIPSM